VLEAINYFDFARQIRRDQSDEVIK